MTVENVLILKSNCEDYARTGKSIAVLKNANGKRNYTDIAKIVGMHQTRVSSLLKKAENLGLAKKIKPGIYKKIPGILSYMPQTNRVKSESGKTVSDMIKKMKNYKKLNNSSPIHPNLTIPSKIDNSVEKMMKAYRYLYSTENVLRELVRKVLNTKAGWWKNYVPGGIQAEVKRTIDESPYDAVTRNDELEYTHLGQLKEIIIYKKNWNDFLPYLNEKNKNSFSATIDKAIP